MKYWTFDVCQLIDDYITNKRVLAAVNLEIKNCEKQIESPINGSTRGDWEQMLKILDLRRQEYEMYVDMVHLGLNDLPEIERDVLRMWLIEHKQDKTILELTGIANGGELKKIKKLALTRFTNIVMPN